MRERAKKVVSILGLSAVLLADQMPAVYATEATPETKETNEENSNSVEVVEEGKGVTSEENKAEESKFNAVENLTFEKGVCEFDNNNNVEASYLIVVTGPDGNEIAFGNSTSEASIVHTRTSFAEEIFTSGTYIVAVEVKDKDDTSAIINRNSTSYASASFTYTAPDKKLSKPEFAEIKNGNLYLTKQDDAASYCTHVSLKDKDGNSLLNTYTNYFTDYYSLKDIINAVKASESDTFELLLYNMRAYSSDICEIANSDSNTFSKTYTKEELLKCLETEEQESNKLATPSNLRFTFNLLSFDAVDGAESYLVNEKGYDKNGKLYAEMWIPLTAKSLMLYNMQSAISGMQCGTTVPIASIDISVQACAANKESSDYSKVLTYKLSTESDYNAVSNLKYKDGKFSFDTNNEGENYYVMHLYGKLSQIAEKRVLLTGNQHYEVDFSDKITSDDKYTLVVEVLDKNANNSYNYNKKSVASISTEDALDIEENKEEETKQEETKQEETSSDSSVTTTTNESQSSVTQTQERVPEQRPVTITADTKTVITIDYSKNESITDKKNATLGIPSVKIATCVLGNDKVLVADEVKKVSTENVVLNVGVSNSVGFTFNSANVPASAQNISLKTDVKKVDTYKSAGFEAVSFVPEVTQELGFGMVAHLNIGAENQGKTAYIFKKDTKTGNYELIKAAKVNSIGNISLSINSISEILVLFS